MFRWVLFGFVVLQVAVPIYADLNYRSLSDTEAALLLVVFVFPTAFYLYYRRAGRGLDDRQRREGLALFALGSVIAIGWIGVYVEMISAI